MSCHIRLTMIGFMWSDATRCGTVQIYTTVGYMTVDLADSLRRDPSAAVESMGWVNPEHQVINSSRDLPAVLTQAEATELVLLMDLRQPGFLVEVVEVRP